jgi:hypothetical protein
LEEDGAFRGPEWLQGAVADIGRDELRAMAKAAGLPVKSHSKWLTASEKPGLQVRLARISDMTCPRSRCEINVFHLNFIQCEVVEWNTIISFRGGPNF